MKYGTRRRRRRKRRRKRKRSFSSPPSLPLTSKQARDGTGGTTIIIVLFFPHSLFAHGKRERERVAVIIKRERGRRREGGREGGRRRPMGAKKAGLDFFCLLGQIKNAPDFEFRMFAAAFSCGKARLCCFFCGPGILHPSSARLSGERG